MVRAFLEAYAKDLHEMGLGVEQQEEAVIGMVDEGIIKMKFTEDGERFCGMLYDFEKEDYVMLKRESDDQTK